MARARRLGVKERRARLARRHHLAPTARTADVVEVARDLVGVHATDPVSVFVGAAARMNMKRPAVEPVLDALYVHRSLLRMLGMRRTMFVVPLDVAPVVQAACTNTIAARERKRLVGFLESNGIAKDGARWLRKVEPVTLRALAERGEATASELSADVPELREKLHFGAGKKWEGTQSVSGRLLVLLSAEGHVVRGRPRGSWVSTQYRWAPTERWLGKPMRRLAEGAARVELARRYVHAFGPATVADLKWWTGWTAGETNKALRELDPVEVELDGGGVGLLLADDVQPVRAVKPWVALLPALDTTVMGWTERSWFLGELGPALFDRSGNAGPTVWCDGRVVGGWAQRKDGEIAFRLLADVGRDCTSAVQVAAEDVWALLGDVRFTHRFPTPLERELKA
jgi:hypothetical protein